MSAEQQTNIETSIGELCFSGEIEKPHSICEVVLTVGGAMNDILKFPEGGIAFPSESEIVINKPQQLNDHTDESNASNTLGSQGLIRMTALLAYVLYKNQRRIDTQSIIASCGSYGQMSQFFHQYVPDELINGNPSVRIRSPLLETESYDTTTNLLYTLRKIQLYYPELYKKINNGEVGFTIITSGRNVSDKLLTGNKTKDANLLSRFAQTSRETIAGIKNFGTQSFRFAEIIQRLRDMGINIRVLPAEVVINDLSEMYNTETSFEEIKKKPVGSTKSRLLSKIYPLIELISQTAMLTPNGGELKVAEMMRVMASKRVNQSEQETIEKILRKL